MGRPLRSRPRCRASVSSSTSNALSPRSAVTGCPGFAPLPRPRPPRRRRRRAGVSGAAVASAAGRAGAGMRVADLRLARHEDSLGYLGIVDLPFHRAVRELGHVVVLVVLRTSVCRVSVRPLTVAATAAATTALLAGRRRRRAVAGLTRDLGPAESRSTQRAAPTAGRRRSASVRTSGVSLLTKRVSGASDGRGSHRAPSRSIHWCVRNARTSSTVGHTAPTSSAGRKARGWVASSATNVTSSPGSTSGSRWSASSDGRKSSIDSWPFRVRVAMIVAAPIASSCGSLDRVAVGADDGETPRGRRDVLLQRWRVPIDRGHRHDVDAHRERRAQAQRHPWQVDGCSGHVVDQVGVEVLRERLIARRECEAEADAGPGREPLGVGEGDLRAPEGALEHASHVAVAREADLAALGETDTQAAHDAARTGMSGALRCPPTERSCPVPWLPPAGGVAEATTCSIA